MDNIQILTIILAIVLGIMLILLISLGAIYLLSKNKKKDDEAKTSQQAENVNAKRKRYKNYTIQSINDFMEFDTVVDNMISQKNEKRFVMVVACQGINYDLMSETEKNGVEEGFIQFLNTIRHPIQIYTQTRTINLTDSIHTYKNKIKDVEDSLRKQELRYNEMIKDGTYTSEEIDRAYFELTKRRNLYEYGKDIIYDTEKMSLNKNVLNKKYYVVIPYYTDDLEEGSFDKEELRSLAFEELYTRAQTIIRTLSACGINGRIMTSNELVELLYMAYNRDDAEIYGIDKALKAGYEELYTTAQDVVDKQMRELDRQIEAKAKEKAKAKVMQVRTEKQKKLAEKRANSDSLIDELAKLIIEENVDALGDDIAQEAIDKINEEGGARNVKEEKTIRTRKTQQVK